MAEIETNDFESIKAKIAAADNMTYPEGGSALASDFLKKAEREVCGSTENVIALLEFLMSLPPRSFRSSSKISILFDGSNWKKRQTCN